MTIESMKKKVAARGQGGFTLIELLVVIAILAVLAGVVVFAVGNSTKNAKLVACKTERSAVITAVAAARTSNIVTPGENYLDYLKTPLEYFAVQGTADDPTGFSRTAATTADVPDVAPPAGCGAISNTEWL